MCSDAPSAPRQLRCVEVDSSYITLSWDSPASDGGSALTGYVIEKRDMKRADYVFLANVDATTLQYRATRLFEGCDYMFRVFAENQAGLSQPCETEKPITARMPYGSALEFTVDSSLVYTNVQIASYYFLH